MHVKQVRLNVVSIVAEKLRGADHPMLLQQSKHNMSKPSPALDKDHKCESLLVSVEGKPLNRNLVVRSRYFRHKLLDENDHVNKEKKSMLQKDTNGTVCDLTAPENASLGSKFCKNSIRRGKPISAQSIQNVCTSLSVSFLSLFIYFANMKRIQTFRLSRKMQKPRIP